MGRLLDLWTWHWILKLDSRLDQLCPTRRPHVAQLKVLCGPFQVSVAVICCSKTILPTDNLSLF